MVSIWPYHSAGQAGDGTARDSTTVCAPDARHERTSLAILKDADSIFQEAERMQIGNVDVGVGDGAG